jgi:hypothetical protein
LVPGYLSAVASDLGFEAVIVLGLRCMEFYLHCPVPLYDLVHKDMHSFTFVFVL